MGSIGFTELILIFVIVLLIFGGRKIPELAKGLGEGIRSFRESLAGPGTQGHDEKKDKPS
jgi:sec-independent protein translocase protein TatA